MKKILNIIFVIYLIVVGALSFMVLNKVNNYDHNLDLFWNTSLETKISDFSSAKVTIIDNNDIDSIAIDFKTNQLLYNNNQVDTIKQINNNDILFSSGYKLCYQPLFSLPHYIPAIYNGDYQNAVVQINELDSKQNSVDNINQSLQDLCLFYNIKPVQIDNMILTDGSHIKPELLTNGVYTPSNHSSYIILYKHNGAYSMVAEFSR